MGRLSYLLDSNILSEPSRPSPNEHAQARLLAHRHAVCTAAPVLHEMRYGLARMPEGKRKQALTHSALTGETGQAMPALLPFPIPVTNGTDALSRSAERSLPCIPIPYRKICVLSSAGHASKASKAVTVRASPIISCLPVYRRSQIPR
jgi:hypothetical protein